MELVVISLFKPLILMQSHIEDQQSLHALLSWIFPENYLDFRALSAPRCHGRGCFGLPSFMNGCYRWLSKAKAFP